MYKRIDIESTRFIKDFEPLIADLEVGDAYDKSNSQHTSHLHKNVKHSLDGETGKVIALYTQDDIPIGYIWYEHDTGYEGVEFSGKYAHIRQIAVYEEYRRGGYGRQLIDFASEDIRSAGGEVLYTDAYAYANENTLAFYIKTGFIPVALLPGLNGINDHGQVFMYKQLIK